MPCSPPVPYRIELKFAILTRSRLYRYEQTDMDKNKQSIRTSSTLAYRNPLSPMMRGSQVQCAVREAALRN